MEIWILGKGCPKCMKLEQVAHDAAIEAGVEAEFSHITDMDEILKYVSITPGLVINNQVKSSGRIPPRHEIVDWIREATAS